MTTPIFIVGMVLLGLSLLISIFNTKGTSLLAALIAIGFLILGTIMAAYSCIVEAGFLQMLKLWGKHQRSSLRLQRIGLNGSFGCSS